MKTLIMQRDPAKVISSGLVRKADLNQWDAVLIINPDKIQVTPEGGPYEFLVTTGASNEDTPD